MGGAGVKSCRAEHGALMREAGGVKSKKIHEQVVSQQDKQRWTGKRQALIAATLTPIPVFHLFAFFEQF